MSDGSKRKWVRHVAKRGLKSAYRTVRPRVSDHVVQDFEVWLVHRAERLISKPSRPASRLGVRRRAFLLVTIAGRWFMVD